MSADRRALHSPFSSSPLDAPLPAEDGERLLPVERAPFLEPPAPAGEDDLPQCAHPQAGRRRLGPGAPPSRPTPPAEPAAHRTTGTGPATAARDTLLGAGGRPGPVNGIPGFARADPVGISPPPPYGGGTRAITSARVGCRRPDEGARVNPTTEPAFTTTVHATATGPLIEAAGALDLDGAPILHAALRRALAADPAAPRLVLDLAGVTFCDSSGLNALWRARTQTGRAGTSLHLVRPASAVADLLEITGADRVFTIDNDKPDIPDPRIA
ncbi:STAS domain-containing protein [Kitasatospora indigofera]|uniref:STAS domain-containing protein n=1 Tax=Kitasatospora indigofera TaxID=67307 RepID=UPI0036CDCD91